MANSIEKIGGTNQSSGWDKFDPMPFNFIPAGQNTENKEPETSPDSEPIDGEPDEEPFDWDEYSENFDKDFDSNFWDEEEPLYYKFINLSPSERTSVLLNSPPIKQLKFLSILIKHASYDELPEFPSDVGGTLQQIIKSEKSAPLVKLGAEYLADVIGDADDDYMFGYDYDEDYKYEKEDEQDKLREKFPNLPGVFSIRKIAPDAAICGKCLGTPDGKVVILDGEVGNREMLDLPDGFDEALVNKSDIGLDDDTAILLDTVYDRESSIKEMIDEKLELDLTEIPLETQVQLLKFMTEAGDARFERLCGTLKNSDKDKREMILNNFVRVRDFGYDYGDMLLEVANSENISGEQFNEIISKFDSCQKSIEQTTKLYAGFDGGEFAKQYKRAASERLADAVVVFSEIAKKGIAEADLGWAGDAVFDYDSAIEALGYEEKSLRIISGTFNDVISGVDGSYVEVVLPYESDQAQTRRTLYNFFSPNYGNFLLYTRPEGSHSLGSLIEYGKRSNKYDEQSGNTGVEASISMIVNPIDPFLLPNPFRPEEKSDGLPYSNDPKLQKVSAIRLDREGRTLEMAANDPNRDTIAENGSVSVDLAAINDRDDTPSGMIARLLSVGNQIRAKNTGQESTLNHNRKWFNQEKYGTSEGFEKIVNYIDKNILRLAAVYPPKKGQEFFGKWRQQEYKLRADALRAGIVELPEGYLNSLNTKGGRLREDDWAYDEKDDEENRERTA